MGNVKQKALRVRVANPNVILNTIKKSKLLDSGEVLVHWGIKESQALNRLGIKNVPSPVLQSYEWSGSFTPFEHQRTTTEFLTLHKRAGCWNEQGTGKTSSCIWAADSLMERGIIKKVLVICPLSIMQSAWLDDLFSVAMHRSASVCYGTREKRIKIIKEDTEFLIINYDGIEIVNEELAKANFDLIIVDEANAYKNVSTKRFKALQKLITDDTWVWLLTGTPASQSPYDAYGLAKLINPDGVPRYAGRWRDTVMLKVSRFKWEPRPEAKLLVHNALQPAIRFTKEQCLDLPSLTYVTRDVELTVQQKKYYRQIKETLFANAAGEDITVVNAAAAMNKLLQLSGGAVYSDTGEIVSFDVKSRFKVLKEIIDESSQKVIVFVPYRHAIKILQEELTKDGYSCEVINGEVKVGKRTSIFSDFQNKENPRILLIQPQAASHGVTLHRANTIIYWSPVMSVETYLQCNARAHRAGQKNPVTVFHIRGSEVEKRIYKMLKSKIDVHSNIVKLYDIVSRESTTV